MLLAISRSRTGTGALSVASGDRDRFAKPQRSGRGNESATYFSPQRVQFTVSRPQGHQPQLLQQAILWG